MIPASQYNNHNRVQWAHTWFLLCVYLVAIGGFTGTGVAFADAISDQIAMAMNDVRLGSSNITFYARDLVSGDVIAENNADLPMIPASNMKLITTGTALIVLGPEFAYETMLIQTEDGKLVVQGSGDPCFGDPKLLGEMGFGVNDLLDVWVDAINDAGIKHIPELIVDDRVFDREFHQPTWMAEDLIEPYGAQVSGLAFYNNVVRFYFRPAGNAGIAPTFRLEPAYGDDLVITNNAITNTKKGSAKSSVWISRPMGANEFTVRGNVRHAREATVDVTVHNIPDLFATLFANRLKTHGIRVDTARVIQLGEDRLVGKPIAPTIRTPLTTILLRANTDSHNLSAESLLKRIGHEATGQPGSWVTGSAIVRSTVTSRLGPALAMEIIMADGSGLSRSNRITPRMLTNWLGMIYQDDAISGLYLESLAIGGQTGTLKKRFHTIKVKGQVRAKSGYMRGISCLSGYVTADNGRTAAFSILINQIPPTVTIKEAKKLQERLVSIFAEYLALQDAVATTIPERTAPERTAVGTP